MAYGQAASEFIVLMGISLLIISIFLVTASQSISDIGVQKNMDEARNTVSLLAQSADSVYAQGEGASRLIYVAIPRTANMDRSYIGRPQGDTWSTPKTINLNVGGNAGEGGGDIIATSSATVLGSFPAFPGSYYMRVVSKGGYVLINPALIDVSTSSVFVSMALGESRTASIKFRSIQNESITVSRVYSWGFPNVTLTVDPESIDASQFGSQFDLAISSVEGAGTFNSNLVLNAVGSQSGVNESFEIPISVVVLG